MMKQKTSATSVKEIEQTIYVIRRQCVMLDGVQFKVLDNHISDTMKSVGAASPPRCVRFRSRRDAAPTTDCNSASKMFFDGLPKGSNCTLLDADLARIYGVETKALNRAVKRNKKRFPSDFVFRLTNKEEKNLRSQIGTASKRNVRYLPYGFTEHGAIMAANVLNSPRAAQMSVFVVSAFVRMRAMLTDNRELAAALKALEKELKERLDTHEAAIVDILRRLMDIIDPPPLPEPPRKEIGFHVKESHSAYRAHRKQT